MEVNEQNLRSLNDLLVRTMSVDNVARKEAEKLIFSIETNPGFLIVLLNLIATLSASTQAQDAGTRQASSVLFKNVIKRHWNPDDGVSPITESDRTSIKAHVIDMMCQTPPDVQKQLAEAVSIISNSDFPEKWTDLLPTLVSKMSTSDIRVNKGVMLTANSIFKRFRFVASSDAVFSELLICLKGFQAPLLQMYQQNGLLIEALAGDKGQLEIAMETQRLMTRIFFSLNWQDLPEFFEDNIQFWMTEFAKYLQYSNPLLVDASEDTEPSVTDKLKAAIVENLNLYASKYEEEFNPFLANFTHLVWTLLTSVGTAQKFEVLATSGIKFLTSVASKQVNTSLFTDTVLRDIIVHIVVPNLTATEVDEENFECNPTDYIRKDIEGSDQDTRRRSASELVRTLLKFFSVQVSQLCTSYIAGMLEEYKATMNWKAKDAALHLVLAASVMSTNSLSGAGSLNPNMNILDIFHSQVLPEIHDRDVNARPIVKADVIKMICVFRSHFPAAFLLELIPHVINHLASESVVIQTYAALCIERFLMIKDRDVTTNISTQRITKDHLAPYLHLLFTGLFQVLDNADLPENDYVMKCVMRVINTLGSDLSLQAAGGIGQVVLSKVMAVLERVCKNPANPQFNHFIFECVALLVRASCVSLRSTNPGIATENCAQFEALLFPPFQMILSADVTEFVPYVFQIMGQLLFTRAPGSGLSDAYRALFVPLLSPVLWERKGNIPALTDLFRAYISVGMAEIISGNNLPGVLGVFQKLLSAKSTEQYAFKLLNALIVHNPMSNLAPYLVTIFSLLLQRMQDQMKDTKTPRYCRYFLHTLSLVAATYGGTPVYDVLESLTPDLTTMMVSVWTNNKAGCTTLDKIELREMIVGGAKILCETPVTTRSEIWVQLFRVIFTITEVESGKQGSSNEDEFTFVDEEADAREFDSTYSKLAFAPIPESTPSSEVAVAPAFFASKLGALFGSFPGQYSGLLQSTLSIEELNGLKSFLSLHGVNFV